MSKTNIKLICAVLAVAVSTSFAKYMFNFIVGPKDIDGAEIARLRPSGIPFHYFVRLTTNRVADTGYYEDVSRIKDGTSTERQRYVFSIAYIGEAGLLVKSESKYLLPVPLPELPQSDAAKEFVGALRLVSDDPIVEDVAEKVRVKFPVPSLPPIFLDTRPFRTEGYLILGVCLLSLALSIWVIRRHLKDA